MAETAKKRATYADLKAVPPHLVAEIMDWPFDAIAFSLGVLWPLHAAEKPASQDEA